MNNNKIAHIVQHLAPGGIETMALDLQRLSSNKDDVYIISLEGTKEQLQNSWDILKNVNNLYFLNKNPGFSLLLIIKLIFLLRKLGIDVIHTHHVGPLIYGGIAAKIAGCRHVHTEHDAWHLENNKRRKIVSAFFKYLKPIIVADAQVVAKNIKKHIPFCNPKTIVNGVDVNKFNISNKFEARKKLNLPLESIIIGCAARLTKVKCHDLLLAAFANLDDNIFLALAGDGELKEQLQQQADNLGISSRIFFLGVIEDMPAFYNAINIFCLVSSMEGLPLSILESQASGIPTIVTNVGGCSEVIDAKTGIIIEPNNKQQLTNALTNKINSLSTNKPNEIREFILNKSNLLDVIEKYNNLYIGI